MSDSDTIKRTFSQGLATEESQINLAQSAMLLSQFLGEPFDISPYLKLLDEMAESVRGPILAAETDWETIQVLNHYLFDELNFFGNSLDYYHPHNSFLNRVLDTRTGIPIALSVIYLEIGWRLDLPVWGCGLPGHFVVGYGSVDAPIYIDVYNQGSILSEDDCLALGRVPLSQRLSFREEFLKPVDKIAILFRMLLNLKQIYVRAENWEAAYKTVDLMLIVRPDQPAEIRDRGLLAYRLQRLQAAAFDLERYLFLAPRAFDKELIKGHLKIAEEKLLRMN